VSRRVVLAGTLGVAIGLTATAISQQPVPLDPSVTLPGVSHQVILSPGDSIVLNGVPLGCAVTTRSAQVVIECGRTDKVAGTYVSILSKRSLKVARMRSADLGKTILTARQGGGWRACGVKARAARTGGSGCR
jgi:hypothetical protein